MKRFCHCLEQVGVEPIASVRSVPARTPAEARTDDREIEPSTPFPSQPILPNHPQPCKLPNVSLVAQALSSHTDSWIAGLARFSSNGGEMEPISANSTGRSNLLPAESSPGERTGYVSLCLQLS